MPASDLPKFSTISVKSVHKCYLFTGFTEVVENIGRSDNDMIYVIKKCLNPLYASMVSCAKRSKNLESYLPDMFHQSNFSNPKHIHGSQRENFENSFCRIQ